ncbi:Protein SCAR3 [Camellia lanceoleosa]|uniref:Protein SCAR3 n=1 Tax=Camellia lanceoleosa TaxID=1840588 RepID=A0ACC0GJS3_9ERIC|nr:Protein SCAR3 [Camellia lanceoleosa]
MPLVRVQVKNQYGLGQPELYREANGEDPKAVLDGVAVAGLVGILRQLGDLAEFAAEVFHGLQEQVMSTCSRSHKLMVRVQRIEAAVPPLEKVILAQKSHLHFAYTAGSVWHARLENGQNQFNGDLPQFIMDSYEECRDPPRLNMLDKFDTGGSGSCLKRYTDPTFFRRASASSGEASVEKISKDRKARRSKKKRTWQRNEASRGASISNLSDRSQLTSLKVDGHISPSQSVSTTDVALKSDLGGQSNSSDSRTETGYIECVFHPTYSMEPEEHEPKESSLSCLRIHHNETVDSASVDEHSGVVDDDFAHSLSEEQTGPISSFVTWDEKTEIVETTGHQYDHDESAEMLTTNFNQDLQEEEAANFRSIDQMDFQFDNEDTPTPISGRNQLDDIESEIDNYVDALNTIESESETDLDCQTKREVKKSSNLNEEATQEDGVHGLAADHSDLQPSNLESHTGDFSNTNNVTSSDKPNSISSQFYANEESHQMVGELSDISNSLGINFCENDDVLDGSNVESGICNLPYSGSSEPNPNAPISENIVSTSCESQKSPTEPLCVQSVKFWTNGSLLGLEPSKPPVFSVAVSQDSVTRSKDEVVSTSSQSNIVNGEGDAGNPDKLVQSSKSIEHVSSKCSTSCHNDKDGISDKKSWRFSPTDIDAKHEKYVDSQPIDRFNDNCECNLSETSAAAPETEQTVTPDGKNASQMFGLENRFLVNSFQRKVSLAHDEKSETPSTRKTGVSEQKSRKPSVAYQTSERTFKGYFGSESPIFSPSSSPPLQHMKISFQPINGFETSKLKLKFPDGSFRQDSGRHDSSRDMLPSFQLIPEPATPLCDIGLDSDDDTFCRSSPYISDDCLSHHSDSNSNQWESDDNSPSKDTELYDAFRRISSTESVSDSMELERTRHGSFHVDYGIQSPYVGSCLEPCQSGQSLDLPSLSNLNPLFEQEMKNGSDANALSESHLPKEPTPLPPPLPPLQWRVMNSHSDMAIGKRESVAEALNHAFDMKILGSTISPKSVSSPVKQQEDTDEAIAFTVRSKPPEWQKPKGQDEVSHSTNGRGVDEKDDFLHQIRAKSFSLRPTVTEKPTVTPGPTSDIKVTAILRKANAIRQAVGSDDGEDWSDT